MIKCDFCGSEAVAVINGLTMDLPTTYVCKDCLPTGKPAKPKKFIDLTVAEMNEAIQKRFQEAIENAGKKTLNNGLDTNKA